MLSSRVKIDRVMLAILVYCGILWIYVYLSLSTSAMPDGDSGQWIMLARFYRGETVPSYLKPAAYPPLYPILLATAITISGNATQAVSLLGATIFVLLGISFFVVGKELWNSSAGFLALVLGSLSQYFFLYATSWGAYPMLLFLAWLNLAVSRFLIIYRGVNIPRRQYVYLSAFLGLCLFTHFPSTIIFVAVFALLGIHFLIGSKQHKIGDKIRLLLAFSTPTIAWSIYVSLIIKETLGYVENEAALFSRGVNTVWSYLFRLPESSAFVIAGVVATALGVVYAFRKRTGVSSFGFYFVSLWTFSTVILMCTLYLLGVKTEYTRFTYLIVPPLALNLAGALSAFVNANMRISIYMEGLKPRNISMKKLWWLLILIFLLLPFPSIHAFYTKSIRYYSVWKPGDFKESLEWIGRNTPVEGSVLTSKKIEGRLIEGLTGHDALFSFPERASYRPWEHDRSIAAETLLKSSISIENGYILVKFEKDSRSVPNQPAVSVCREGEYEDALWLRDSLSRITLITPRNEVQTFSIRDISRFSHEILKEPEVIRVISRFEKGVNQTKLYLDRTITIAKDSPVVSVHYSMRTASSFYVQNLSIGILDPWGRTRRNTQLDGELQLFYRTTSQRDMAVRLAWNKPDPTVSSQPLSERDSRIVTWLTFFPDATTSAKLDISIITTPTGRITNDFRLFEASQLVLQYNVTTALLVKDQNTWFKKINLYNIGFNVAFENNSYVVMVRSSNG